VDLGSVTMVFDKQLNYQSVLDGLGQGVLIFDKDDRLLMDNLAARTLLGTDLRIIRASGWSAASTLFNTRASNPDQNADTARKKALESARPVRFHMFRSGEYIPCWAAAVHGSGGEVFTMITIEAPDWTAMTDLMTRFRDEVVNATGATQGHTHLITQSLKAQKPGETVEQLGRRISGFVQIISTHMHRLSRLMDLFERLEQVRTGRLPDLVRSERRKIDLVDFVEDFIETLDETQLIDPETEAQDYRSRITTTVPDNLYVHASPDRLTNILHDLLRNAIMYSMKATPIMIIAQASAQNQSVQIDVVDEGYGIRAKEFERVFGLFERARQPQIMGEFGYGLSLYLCKQEVEAMNGKIWFESEEGVGTTFSFKLPLWRDDSSSAPLSDTSGSSPITVT
jgi:nitrogen-specific signal transduction histidine kinase